VSAGADDGVLVTARSWLAQDPDPETRAQLSALIGRVEEGNAAASAELADRFAGRLAFGTAGLRGELGAGSNRMNRVLVAQAAAGLAAFVRERAAGEDRVPTVVIGYDGRRNSEVFAQDSAELFAGAGLRAILLPRLLPTPVLAFAVRKLGADAGVMVTASHNPPKYNGYKAYWNDGAQVIAPHDRGIIDRVNAVTEVKTMPRAEALAKGLLVLIDKEIDDAYASMVKSKLLRPALIKEMAAKVKIVYTPLHGTGAMHFERVMRELGLAVSTVPEQREPDGSFPTVSFPNPEEPAALRLAIELGGKEGADVVMATDPDADRLGIAVPDGSGGFALVTGNQLGALHLDYILLTMRELGRLPAKPAVIKSIVTTDLQSRIAAKYGATMFECLTGFKWIAELMRRFESDGGGFSFVYGTEESYGHLVEDEVRDKDGISAAAITAEAALYWRSKGKSLLQRLDELYLEHGFFEERGVSKYFEGPTGMDTMRGIMEGYRRSQPSAIGGIRVDRIRDVKALKSWEPGREAEAKAVDLPSSDVIQWYLQDGTMVTVRPSGTEPKIKYYILCRTEASRGLEAARKESAAKAAAIEAEIRKAVGA